MNKELTAMQMLIGAMQKEYKSIEKDGGTPERYIREEIKMRIQQAKYLLQKEQEQIEKAFDKGYKRGDSLLFVEGEPDEGSEYYKSKYGGEDEN